MERAEIIKKAILTELSDGVEIFSSDDILTVAGVSDMDREQLEALIDKFCDSIKIKPINEE